MVAGPVAGGLKAQAGAADDAVAWLNMVVTWLCDAAI